MPDTPDDGPSLEMPSFPLRRRRKRAPADVVPETEPVVPEPEPTAVIRDPAPTEPEAAEGGGRPARAAPAITGLPAALLTGLLVGGLAVALAWLAGAGCDAVRGTTACGGAAGLPILIAGLVLLAWVGALLLKLFGVGDAGSTSILAVSLLAVLVMLFLLEVVDEPWGAVVVPALAVIAYGLAWWVTTSVVDDAGAQAPEPRDVR